MTLVNLKFYSKMLKKIFWPKQLLWKRNYIWRHSLRKYLNVSFNWDTLLDKCVNCVAALLSE